MRVEYVYPASQAIEDKLIEKHQVDMGEVAELFSNEPSVRRLGRDQYDEMRYGASGQTKSGRYLSVVFIWEQPETGRIITAREMTDKEKRAFRRLRSSR